MTNLYVSVDCKQNELLNPVIHKSATAPSNPVEAQLYYDSTAGVKCLKVHNGTEWIKVGAGVEKVDVVTDEKVIAVDNTDSALPLLSFKKSATQGEGVTLTSESDGLKVAVQDGTTSQKGIVKLDNTPSATEDTTAATPKGANVTLEQAATATTGSAYTYTFSQGGTALTNKVEMLQATTAVVGMVKLDNTPSATEETTAATPKGANVTLEQAATAEEGYVKTYVLKQGGNEVGKINIPKDFLVKSGKVVAVVDYAVATAYSKNDVILNGGNAYVVTADITAADNTGIDAVSKTQVSGTFAAGDKALVFVINVKAGTAEVDEYLVINVKDFIDIYTGGNGINIDANNEVTVKVEKGLDFETDGKLSVVVADGLAFNGDKKLIAQVASGLKIDGDNKIAIDNVITAQDTSAVYPVKITANGLIKEYGTAVNLPKVVTGTIASGTKTVDVTFDGTYLSSYAMDADGMICVVDMKVDATNKKVTFSTAENVAADISVAVVSMSATVA